MSAIFALFTLMKWRPQVGTRHLTGPTPPAREPSASRSFSNQLANPDLVIRPWMLWVTNDFGRTHGAAGAVRVQPGRQAQASPCRGRLRSTFLVPEVPMLGDIGMDLRNVHTIYAARCVMSQATSVWWWWIYYARREVPIGPRRLLVTFPYVWSLTPQAPRFVVSSLAADQPCVSTLRFKVSLTPFDLFFVN